MGLGRAVSKGRGRSQSSAGDWGAGDGDGHGDGDDPSLSSAVSSALSRWPAITDVQRRAFMGQHDTERCNELGKITRSDGVLRDAVGWIGPLETLLRERHPELEGYKPQRFVFGPVPSVKLSCPQTNTPTYATTFVLYGN